MNDSLQNTATPRWRSKAGVSMIEVIIAVLVLGAVVASTITAMRSGFTMIQLARDNTMASQILQSEMENLRLMSWNELIQLEEVEQFQVGEDFDASIAARYEATRRIFEDENREGVKEVELEVQWTNLNGAQHRRVYRTTFTKNGLNDYYYRAL